jgi:hypothetical protein
VNKVVPKQLAVEFNRRPAWIRKQLRAHYGRVKGVGLCWEFNEREARKVREWLSHLLRREKLS